MEEIEINLKNEFYADFDKYYGCKVAANGNMTRKQFCDLIVYEVAEADYIMQIDFNDVRTIFNRIQIADAAVENCLISDYCTKLRDVVNCFKKHHKQAKIRYIMFLILVSESEEMTMTKMQSFIKGLSELFNEIEKHDTLSHIWGLAKDKKLRQLYTF